LGVNRVGLDDNFFELGGDSILSIRLSHRARALGLTLAPRDIFVYATMGELAAALERHQGEDLPVVTRDLSAEATLVANIVPASQSPAASLVENILLTGASGLLGCYLLADLLKSTSATVHCLVRCSTAKEGLIRITAKLKSFGLWDEAMTARIVIIPGDISKLRLGCSADQFDAMANLIDAIYHSAAMVNHVYSYDLMKSANVLGTQELIRMACLGRRKVLHHISTISVLPQVFGESGPITEEERFERWQNLFSGYAQTKWVGEKLVRIAGSRGVPVAIYRPGFIAGSSQAGAGNRVDFVSRFIVACLQLGCAPDIDFGLNMLPVDYMSRAIVALSLREEFRGRCVNVVNEKSTSLGMVSDCLVSWALTLGLPMQKVSFETWWSQCNATEDQKAVRIYFPDPAQMPATQSAGARAEEAEMDSESHRLLQEEGIHRPVITRELLQKYIAYLATSVIGDAITAPAAGD
jgi:thioester reductase-like protein